MPHTIKSERKPIQSQYEGSATSSLTLADLDASQLGEVFDAVAEGSGDGVRHKDVTGAMLLALLKPLPDAGSSVTVETRRVLLSTCDLATETPDLTVSRFVAALNAYRRDV